MDVKVAVCAPAVPCGAATPQVFKKAGVTVNPVSEETSVSGVVTKVSLGEADAGIVYVTDVKAGGSKIAGVPIPADQNVTADYPIVGAQGRAELRRGGGVRRLRAQPAARRCWPAYGFLPPG